jgi:hypothetical protein
MSKPKQRGQGHALLAALLALFWRHRGVSRNALRKNPAGVIRFSLQRLTFAFFACAAALCLSHRFSPC